MYHGFDGLVGTDEGLGYVIRVCWVCFECFTERCCGFALYICAGTLEKLIWVGLDGGTMISLIDEHGSVSYSVHRGVGC